MCKSWIRLLAVCLAMLLSLTPSPAWAASPANSFGSFGKNGDPKFQGIPLQCYVTLADAGTSPEAKVAAYGEIANKYVEAKRLKQAKEVLEKSIAATKQITDPPLRAFAFLDTAAQLTKAEQPKIALATLDEAIALGKDLPDPVDRVFANIKIAQAYGKAGKKEKAQNLLADAIKASPEVIDAYVRSRAFSAIANVYTELGDDFNSEAAITSAAELLPMIEDPNIKSRARVEISGSYAQAGNHTKAIAYLENAFQEFDALKDKTIAAAKEANQESNKESNKDTGKAKKDLKKDSKDSKDSKASAKPPLDLEVVEKTATANSEILKVRSLFLVASQYITAKQYDKALEVINNLDARSVEKPVGVANVAIAYAKDKNNAQATKLFEEAIAGLDQVQPSLDVFTLLIEVGRQYRTINNPEAASQVWQKAEVIADKLTQPAERLFALNNLASNYGEFGLTDKVAPILATSLELAPNIADVNVRSRAFSDISSTYWAIGQQDKAKEIAQTIENPSEKQQLNSLFNCAS